MLHSPDILSTKKKTIKSEHYTKDVYDAYIFYEKKNSTHNEVIIKEVFTMHLYDNVHPTWAFNDKRF